ncbi:MAG: GNAT family N-acetyltransferase [Bacteroidales bacterium]|nr:GNAT family N-acetyltransferase [Bacteroidales bacterium]
MQKSKGHSIVRITDIKFLDEIVTLHLNAFRSVLSGQTGKHFLKCYYKNILKKGFVFVKITDGRLSGFIAGIEDDDLLYNIKYYFWAGFGIFTHIWSPALIRSLFRHIKRQRAFRDITIKPELLSIAVRDDMRGKGIGTSLVDALEKYFTEKHVQVYKVYTDMQYSKGSQLYEKLGFEFLREVDLFGLPFRLYVRNLNYK